MSEWEDFVATLAAPVAQALSDEGLASFTAIAGFDDPTLRDLGLRLGDIACIRETVKTMERATPADRGTCYVICDDTIVEVQMTEQSGAFPYWATFQCGQKTIRRKKKITQPHPL